MTQPNYNNGNLALKIIIGVIILLFIIGFFKGCFDKPEAEIIIKTKEIKGGFKPVKPIHDTIFLTKIVKSKPLTSNDEFLQSEIDRLLKEYTDLDEAFANANDSLQQVIYSKTIQPKSFAHTFDNDTLNATIKGIVANGEVDKLKLDYTIKPHLETVKIPQTVFRLLTGIEVGMTRTLSNFNIKANVGFQNKRSNVFTVAIDSQQRIYLGYTASVFSIKR